MHTSDTKTKKQFDAQVECISKYIPWNFITYRDNQHLYKNCVCLDWLAALSSKQLRHPTRNKVYKINNVGF